jgi:hypothetical protein
VTDHESLMPALAIDRLHRGATLIAALFEGLPPDVVRWKPAPGKWSLLEVVNHLADEEVEDFRTRVQLTLRDPAAAWPPIAPQEWVTQRGYAARDPAESLARFRRERRASLDWLASLPAVAIGPPNASGMGRPGAGVGAGAGATGTADGWDRAHVHPSLGPLTARGLLANWIAHDLLHSRQMLRLHHERLARLAAPATLDYAGPLT